MAMEPVIGILHLEALYASVTHEKNVLGCEILLHLFLNIFQSHSICKIK